MYSGKGDLNLALLGQPEEFKSTRYLAADSKIDSKSLKDKDQKDDTRITVDLKQLNLFRVKSHCTYNPVYANTENYSIFQVEILDPRLKQHYGGEFVLEVWTRQGERIFQKVLQNEIPHWRVHDNVLIFRTSANSGRIYVLFLNERKMTSVKNPFGEFAAGDMIYHKGCIIISYEKSIRFLDIKADEVTSTVDQFMNLDKGADRPKNDEPMFEEKSFTGKNADDNIFSLVYNPLRDEVVTVSYDDNAKLIYHTVEITLEAFSDRLKLIQYIPNNYSPSSSLKFDLPKTELLKSKPVQTQFIVFNSVPYLLVLRENKYCEIVRNFQETILSDTSVAIDRFYPAFSGQIVIKFADNSMKKCKGLDTFMTREYIKTDEYYLNQTIPPQDSFHYELHRGINFFQDAVTVNQTMFLIRDNAIILVDTFKEKVANIFLPPHGYEGPKCMKLHKLKKQEEDAVGFRSFIYKVVAVFRKGTFSVFVPKETNLMTDWELIERQPVIQIRDSSYVVNSFQNQASISSLFISTINPQNKTQTLYQMPFNATVIELSDLKLKDEDTVLSATTTSRLRELLCVVDVKYFTIYRIDMGKIIKIYSLNHTRYEIRDYINLNSLVYYAKDFSYIFAKKNVYKINVATNAIENTKLDGSIQPGGTLTIDAQFFYFLVAKSQKKGQKRLPQTKLTCVQTDMIEASLKEATKMDGVFVQDKDKKFTENELLHPTMEFEDKQITCLDYDEFNTCINLLLPNLTVWQVPLMHRNTQQFIGMGERSFYLCNRKANGYFYALDKQGYVNQWCTDTGRLVSRKLVETAIYDGYEEDRDVYDRNWYRYSVIYKRDVLKPECRRYKILEISKDGVLKEHQTFLHPFQKGQEQHLYFNKDFTKMIELTLVPSENRADGTKAFYTEYTTTYSSSSLEKTWDKTKVLNEALENYPEWHEKTLYPYPLDQDNLNVIVWPDKENAPALNNEEAKEKVLDTEEVDTKTYMSTLKIDKKEEIYKVLRGGQTIKVFNQKDWNERIIDARTGEVLYFMGLQYSMQNTKDSFYDKSTGQLLILEIDERISLYYDYIREQMFLDQRLEIAKAQNRPINIKLVKVDHSARMYKHKYVSEKPYLELDQHFLRQFFNAHHQTEDRELKNLRIVRRIAQAQLKRMLGSVYPCDELFGKDMGDSNTLLHYFTKHQLGFETIDYICTAIVKQENLFVPFLINTMQKTPLDISVENEDEKMTNSIIKLLKRAPMDNHSRLISHLMPKMIGEMDLPKLNKYFDRRMYQISKCKVTKSLRISLPGTDYDMKAIPTGLQFDESINQGLSHQNAPLRSVKLEMMDLPLNEKPYLKPQKVLDTGFGVELNKQEIALIKALATTVNQDITSQKTIRAFIDYMWPIAQERIIKSVFLPYLVFTTFFLLYMMTLKRLSVLSEGEDKQFYAFAESMFILYDVMFKFVISLGAFYFITHDLNQMSAGLGRNQINLWAYMNIVPLGLIIFVLVWDTFVTTKTGEVKRSQLQNSLYSVIAFLIWTRVVHLLKCFTNTAHLIRMSTEIIYRIRWLIAFILISLTSFGFTYFFISEKTVDPMEGISQMFNVMINQYDVSTFNNIYESFLLILSTIFNSLVIFTLLIAISVISFTKNDRGVWSNEAYHDKASLMALYSYLLKEKAVRAPSDQYLLVATVTDGAKKNELGGSQLSGIANDPRVQQAKNIKSIDRRLNSLQSKLDRTIRTMLDKIGGDQDKQDAARAR